MGPERQVDLSGRRQKVRNVNNGRVEEQVSCSCGDLLGFTQRSGWTESETRRCSS
jgi:hypothetical protein